MVGDKIRRQLKEQETKLPGGSHGFERSHELGDGSLAVAQTLEMCDPLRRFEAEPEAWRRRVQPTFKLDGRRKRPERIVDLDGGHATRIELQKGA